MKNILLTLFIVMNLFSSCSNTSSQSNPTLSLSTQQIGITSAHNARQLGGYRVGDKTIVPNLLLRSGHLAKLSVEDSARLTDVYRLNRVYDFRSEEEMTSAPDILPPHATTLPLSVSFSLGKNAEEAHVKMDSQKDIVRYLLAYAERPELQALCHGLYDNILLNASSQEVYRKFFIDLMEQDPAEGAILWHCTQGKDRAGCASALLLAALGADRELIMADFSLSGVYYDPLVQQIEVKTDAQRLIVTTLLSVNTAIFEATLDKIDKQYGSLQQYLKVCLGVSDEMMHTLRERYLEKN